MNSNPSNGVGKGLNKNNKPDKNAVYSNVLSGTAVFDMYVCQDCNPRYSYCYAKYYSYGPNSYVSITPPKAGASYYVMVYARNGSGIFTLKANSYKCPGNGMNTASSFAERSYASGSGESSTGTEIPVPPAQFIQR
jgi:hypothetical protein